MPHGVFVKSVTGLDCGIQVKVENQSVFQDIASLTAVANSYSTTELLVESQCDIYVQKIGNNYAAFT